MDLVNKIRTVWSTDYDGEVYASSENYTYYASSDDINGDFPTKVEDFKEGAKLSGILYHQYNPGYNDVAAPTALSSRQARRTDRDVRDSQ